MTPPTQPAYLPLIREIGRGAFCSDSQRGTGSADRSAWPSAWPRALLRAKGSPERIFSAAISPGGAWRASIAAPWPDVYSI